MSEDVNARLGFDAGMEGRAGPHLSAAVCFRLIQALARRQRAAMDRALEDAGVTTQQAALLTTIGPGGAPSLSEAAAALQTSYQNIKQLAAALERKGLLETRRDPADRRIQRLAQTPACAAFWASRDPGDYAAVGGMFQALSPDELGELQALLAKLFNSPPHPAG